MAIIGDILHAVSESGIIICKLLAIGYLRPDFTEFLFGLGITNEVKDQRLLLNILTFAARTSDQLK